MNTTVDINCDVGEGLDNEAQLMPFISSCNIACGGHAGDTQTMIKTIKLALKYTVKIGAHPSFPDVANFGRKVMDMNPFELQQSLEDQIIRLTTHIDELGANLHHVKPHGALYNLAAIDGATSQILVNAVKNTTNNVPLYTPYNSKLALVARENQLKVIVEAFGDRNYNTDLTLVSRNSENALLTNKQLVLSHLVHMIKNKEVISIDGVGVKMSAKTFCIHGDNPRAIEVVKYLSKELLKLNIKID